ncbi:MAG: hypothetical protein AABY15_02645 [Nanoarchaeota archaeon]
MNYLLVFKSDGKHYLVMRKSEEHNAYAISAYVSKEDVMKAFEGYTKGWTSNYERSMSCTIGMMNMQPTAIQAPDNVEDIKKYILEEKMYHVTGGAMNGGYHGMPVTEDILELKQFNIWDESMRLAGIKE